MKSFLFLFISIISFGATASVSCDVNDFLKSADGKEKLNSLVERSRSLIISKLEDLGIEEDKVEVKALLPKNLSDTDSKLEIKIKAKSIVAEGSKMTLAKAIQDDDCGIEVKIYSGHLLNKESGKDFGSLGRVKEFIRLK